MAFCEGAVEANSGLAIAGGETEGGSATQGPDLQELIPWCSGLQSSLYHYMPGAHHINCWQLIISSGKELPASKFEFLRKLLSFHYCADISYIQFHWVCTFCIQHAHWSLIWSPTSFFLQLQHYWGNLSKKEASPRKPCPSWLFYSNFQKVCVLALLKSIDGSVLALLRLPSIFSHQNFTVGEFGCTMAIMQES